MHREIDLSLPKGILVLAFKGDGLLEFFLWILEINAGTPPITLISIELGSVIFDGDQSRKRAASSIVQISHAD